MFVMNHWIPAFAGWHIEALLLMEQQRPILFIRSAVYVRPMALGRCPASVTRVEPFSFKTLLQSAGFHRDLAAHREIDYCQVAIFGAGRVDPVLRALLRDLDKCVIRLQFPPAYGSEEIHDVTIAFQHDHALWLDVGKRNNLLQASEILRQIYQHD